MDKDKKSKLDSVLKGINKKFGLNTVMKGSEAVKSGVLEKRVIRTPSLELNDALGGGFCKIVELYGPQSSGKTSLAIETIVQMQKDDKDAVAAWLETEESITKEILELHGVDLERLVYWSQKDVGNAENALDVARALISSGTINMMVVNSVAGLAPKTEIEDDLDKQNIALVARLLAKFFRVITGVSSKNNVTIIFINQLRDNVGSLYGNPTVTTGGKALGFYASQRVQMQSVKIKKEDPVTENDWIKISNKVTKNRFSGNKNPAKSCTYYARYDTGIDSIVPLPDFLLEDGIVRQSGAWWYYEKDGQVVNYHGIECKWKSRSDFVNCLRNNNNLFIHLKSQLKSLSQDLSEEEINAILLEEEKLKQEMIEIVGQEIEEFNDEVNDSTIYDS